MHECHHVQCRYADVNAAMLYAALLDFIMLSAVCADCHYAKCL